MAKTFLCRRSFVAMAVMTNAIDHVSKDLHREEKRGDRATIAVAELLLILGFMHYLLGDYGKAESFLVRYVAIAREQFGQHTRGTLEGLGLLFEIYVGLNRMNDVARVGKEANSLARKLGMPLHDPLVEALFRRAKGYEDESNPHSRPLGFAFALMSLCWCVTRGFYAAPAGIQVLEGLWLFFKSCGIGDEYREWVKKHARLNKYDFVGLLSILLHHTGLEPEPLTAVAKRASARAPRRAAQP